MAATTISGGSRVQHWHWVSTDYYPAWRNFEHDCGTMADDECLHGRTPAERIADPMVCACGGSPQLPRPVRK